MKPLIVLATLIASPGGGPGIARVQYSDPPDSAQSRTENEIAAGIDAYRARLGLPRIARSPALERVARAHATDLATHHPDRGTDARGLACNMHSWSGHGGWTPVCYTSDHFYASAMWRKPSEISGGAYRGDGFEIAYRTTARQVAAADAIATWLLSSGHHTLIAEQGTWANARWRAMGVGVSGGYAVVWFGKVADRTGE